MTLTPDENKVTALDTSDALDNAMVVIDIKAWLFLLTLVLVIGATALWAFFGTMRITVNAQGALVKSGKVIEIYAAQDARLIDIAVSRNQEVEKDQVIARVEQPELVNQINALISENADAAQIEAMRKTLLAESQIVTFEEGRVQDIYVREGDYLSKDTRIATLLQSPKQGQVLQCLLYVPIDSIGKIKMGMSVNVFPSFADKNEYGSMIGTVDAISEFPVTLLHLTETLGNEELAADFAKQTVYEVSVSLVASEKNTTGYEWTISEGPNAEIGNLSLCDAVIIQKTVRPIDVFFFNKY